MAAFSLLILLGCALCFGTYLNGKNTSQDLALKTKNLTCKIKLRATFKREKWTTEMGWEKLRRDIIQGQLLVRIMEKLANTGTENGLHCIFNKTRYMLTCCDYGNLDTYQQVSRKEETASQKFWGYEISQPNLVFMLINLFLLIFIMSWGLILTITYSETLLPVWLTESEENTELLVYNTDGF